jgi:hypothetical protein
MSVTPKEILETAKRLLNNPTSESDMRSAASRAYYAALHATDRAIPNTFAGNDKTADPGSSHDAIIGKAGRLSKAFTPGRTEAAQLFAMLPKMKVTRVKADYRLGENVESKTYSHAVSQAEKALSLCCDLARKLNTSAP